MSDEHSAESVRPKRYYAGHRVERRGESWMCSCGQFLGRDGRAVARDVMRFHRLDLWMAERKAAEA